MKAKQIIQTLRLELRPYAKRDLPALKALLVDDEIKRSFMIPDFSSDTALTAMAEKLRQFSLSDAHFERGIFLDNVLIGFINDVEITEDTIEVGYVIHPAYQRRGYATETLAAAIGELLNCGFSQVITGAFDSNAASIRVMQKCGMEKLDREDDVEYRGRTHHCVYYAARA